MSKEGDKESSKLGNYIIISLIIGFGFGYLFGTGYNSIPKAYNYIIDNPTDYIEFINNSYAKDKEKLGDCVNHGNCPGIEKQLNADKKAWFNKDKTKEEIEEFINKKRERMQNLYAEHYNTQEPTDYLIDKEVFNSLQMNGTIDKDVDFEKQGLKSLLRY